MRNKKAQFFAISLVLICLIMSGVIVSSFFIQKRNVSNSMVSPVRVLEIRDSQALFEMQEKNLIMLSGRSVLVSGGNESWSTERFIPDFRDRFFSEFFNQDNRWMMGFLLLNLSLGGLEASREAFDTKEEQKAFLTNLYEFRFSGQNFLVKRKELTKVMKLKGDEETKINFVVGVEYVYKKDFSFSIGELREEKKVNGV